MNQQAFPERHWVQIVRVASNPLIQMHGSSVKIWNLRLFKVLQEKYLKLTLGPDILEVWLLYLWRMLLDVLEGPDPCSFLSYEQETD